MVLMDYYSEFELESCSLWSADGVQVAVLPSSTSSSYIPSLPPTSTLSKPQSTRNVRDCTLKTSCTTSILKVAPSPLVAH
jgi:hypothetical protein